MAPRFLARSAVAVAFTCSLFVADAAASGAAPPSPPPSPTLRFATNFGSHMVLQRAPQRAVVWGRCASATDCSGVKVDLDGSPADMAAAVVPGTWVAKLPATAGGDTPHKVTATEESNAVALTDVLFGDVWVCSGQSNMAFLLENAFNGSDLVADADNHPTIRLFTSKKTSVTEPLLEQPVVEEPWNISSHVTVSDDGCPHCNKSDARWGAGLGDDNWLYMSAVCYLFGRNVQARTGLPVGLVNTNWGGTPVEFWTSTEALNTCAASTGKSGGAYNGMIKPLLNMTIFGAIWYQGEANQGDAFTEVDPQGLPMVSYGCRFPAMIRDWRAKWHEGTQGETDPEFPFGFVQLAPWIQKSNGPGGVRWGQTAGYGTVPNPAMPNVFDAVAIDLTDRTSPYGSVHIRDKTTVGERLAAGAAAVAYNASGVYWQGPVAASASVTPSRDGATVPFSNVGAGGLELRNASGWEVCVLLPPAPAPTGAAVAKPPPPPPPPSTPNCTATNVAVPGAAPKAGVWQPASASLSTTAVVALRFPAMPKGTVVVRYAWASAPFEYKQAGVYAKAESMPAGPFVKVAAGA